MQRPDGEQLQADILESIETLERQANDPTMPRPVRNRAAWAAMRRRQLVQRYPRLFRVNSGKENNPHAHVP